MSAGACGKRVSGSRRTWPWSGYGDLDVSAYVTPALTTLTIPYEEIADTVMDLMLERLRGDGEVRQVTLRSRLVVRESCGS